MSTPAPIVESPAHIIVVQLQPALVPAGVSAASGAGGGGQITAQDDATFAGDLLAKATYLVTSVGPEHLADHLRKSPADLVVLPAALDRHGMPFEPALRQALETVHSTADAAPCPTLLVGVPPDGPSIDTAIALGVTDFIVHGFHADELTARARELIHKGREERLLRERTRRLALGIAQRDDQLDDLKRFSEDIVSALTAHVLVIDRELTVLFVNQAFLKDRRQNRDQVVGHKLTEFLAAGALDSAFGDALTVTLEEGREQEAGRITDLIHGDAGRVFNVYLKPIDYEGVRQILIVAEDATEVEQALNEAFHEKTKLQELVNAIGVSVILVAQDSSLFWSNKIFEDSFGEKSPEQGRRAFWNALKNQDQVLDTTFRTAKARSVQFKFIDPDGFPKHCTHFLAPILDKDRRRTQMMIVTQDTTAQARRAEQLETLRRLGQLLGATLELDTLYMTILICATAGNALGFNRGFLFVRNRERNTLEGRVAVGPASREHAFQIWNELSHRDLSLEDIVRDAVKARPADLPLYHTVRDAAYPLTDTKEIVTRCAVEKRSIHIQDAQHDERVSKAFLARFQVQDFVVAPLVSKDTVRAVLMVDNLYSGRKLQPHDIDIVRLFAERAGMALANAEDYRNLNQRMEELHRAHDQLVHAEKLAMVGRMAAHVAHEIRNPLTTIGGFAKAILKKAEDVERVRNNAAIIDEEVTRLERILRGVMDFSKPMKPDRNLADVNLAIRHALSSVSNLITAKNVQLETDLDPSLPELFIDKHQIQQVFINIFKNAAEAFTDAGQYGSVGNLLHVHSSRQDANVVIRITDNGPGMPPDVLDRAFSPFFTTKADGTGLGLALCRQIVEDHNGNIKLDSQEGVGTTFTFTFPINAPTA